MLRGLALGEDGVQLILAERVATFPGTGGGGEPGEGGHVIAAAGSDLPQRGTLNFASGATVTDDPANNETDIVISAATVGAVSTLAVGAPSGVASLDGTGKVPSSQLPTLTVLDVWPVDSEAEMLALSAATVGDLAVRSDTGTTFILTSLPPSTLVNWTELATSAGVTAVNGDPGPSVLLDAADVGAVDLNAVGAPNGVAALDGTGDVPDGQISNTIARLAQLNDHITDPLAAHPGTAVSINAVAFNGHLDSSVINVQLLANAVDALAVTATPDATDVTFDPTGMTFTDGTNVDEALRDIDANMLAAFGGGAPITATYLLATANAGLTNGVVVGTVPGGELGGTWAAPTVDETHSGSSHFEVQAAAEATSAAAIAALSSVYQPLDGDLTSIAALTTTAFGRSLLTQADAAATVTTLDVVPNTALGTTVATLVGGTVPTSQLPSIAINEVFTVASEAAMLALSAAVGDMAIRTDLDPDTMFVLTALPASTLGNWQEVDLGGAVLSVNGQSGTVVLSAADVGAVALTDVGIAGGVASLDGSGDIPDGQIPATITRDSELTAAISTSESGQVRDGDTAGGVLSGTYPNPGFAVDMATQAELDAVITNLNAHVGDFADAHDASAISVDASAFVGQLNAGHTDMQLVAAAVDGLVLDFEGVETVNEIVPILGNVTLGAADVGAVDLNAVGAIDGVAPLDGAGIISTTYLPPFVASVNSLTGVVTIDAAGIDTDTTNFDGVLSAADTTVQLALETLDDAVSSGGGHTIESNGTALTQRTTMNFLGPHVLRDDAGNDETEVDWLLREQSQDESRRAGTIYSGRIRSQLVVDLFIGDSIARGAGGTLGVSDWSTVYAQLESNAGGVAFNGPGIKLVSLDEGAPYGAFDWDNVAVGTGFAGPAAGTTSSHSIAGSGGQVIGDTDRFRRVEVFFHKAASGSPNIEISTDGGSTWSSPVSTTGTGYGSWLSPDLVTTDTRTLQVRTAAAGTATIIGYRGYLTDGTIGYVADNISKGGTDTTDWITDRGWETYATLVEPRRIIIAVGENDALNGGSVGTMAANLTTIVQRAQAAAPLAEIVLVGEQYAWVTGLTAVGFSTWTDTWIPAVEQVARDNGVTFLDHNAIFGDCSESGDPWTITMDGGLHFGAAGQRARAQATFHRLSHSYAYLDTNPTFIAGGTNAAGRRWHIGDIAGDVGLQLFADEGHTIPVVGFGTLSGAPLLAYGAGGNTTPDVLVGRDATDGVLTVTPGIDITDLAGGGEIRIRDFGSNSPSMGFYGAEADTQARLGTGLIAGAARITWGSGGSTAPDIWWRRSAAGTFEHGDNVAADGIVQLIAGQAFGSQITGIHIHSVATDTAATATLHSFAGAPSLEFGPGGSTTADTILTRDSAGVFRAGGLAVDTGAGEVRIVPTGGGSEPGASFFGTSGDTHPKLTVGTAVGVPVIGFGPGGSTAVDATISRTGTNTIGIDGQLDLNATDGVLTLNRLTTTQRDALTPVDGMTIYNTTLGRVEHRIGGQWMDFLSATSIWPTRYRVFDDFDSSVVANTTNDTIYGNQKLGLRVSGTSAGAAAQQGGVEALVGHTVIGVGNLTTGTATTGRSAVSPDPFYTFTSTDVLRFLARVRIPTISDGTQTFIVRIGLVDANTGVQPTNGGFYVEANTNANWMCINMDDSTTTGTNQSSGIAVSNAAYVNIGIHWDGTTCHYWMSTGTSAMTEVITQSGNPPDNGTVLVPVVAIVKSAGTTARTVNIDAMGFDLPFTRGVNFRI